MTPTRQIVAVTDDVCEDIACRVYPPEVTDIWKSAGLSAVDAIKICRDRSVQCWAWIIDGEPACVFGFVPVSMTSKTAAPWVIITDLVLRHKVEFLRSSLKMLKWARQVYPDLRGHVKCDHLDSVKWLTWMGFRVDDDRTVFFTNFELKD